MLYSARLPVKREAYLVTLRVPQGHPEQSRRVKHYLPLD
jgi:hypothetical protein